MSSLRRAFVSSCLLIGVGFAPHALVFAQAATEPAPHFRVFNPLNDLNTYLLDTNNVIVHTWAGTLPAGGPTQVMEDGSLLRFVKTADGIPGTSGGIQRLDFASNLLWDFNFSGPTYACHHEFEQMPNGNILMLVWEKYTAEQAIANGRDPALLTGPDFVPDCIVEIQPTGPTSGSVVWSWHFWDHLIQDFDPTKENYGVVADHPELLDINYPPEVLSNGDYTHCNSIGYDAERDWIVISARSQSEIYIIDHSTTTAEAAGHTGGTHGKGGDFLYRWGNPAAYQRGTEADQQLFKQHTAHFIPEGFPGEGHVLLFNNDKGGDSSAITEVELPIDMGGGFTLEPDGTFGPAAPFWEYVAPVPTDFYSALASSARRAKNGNTLVDSALQGWIFEVNSAGELVWEYINDSITPSTWIYQAKYVERSLWTSGNSIRLGLGGSIDLEILSGSPHAGRLYWTLGSASGTAPGIAAGLQTLPLNLDAYLLNTLTKPNGALLQDSLGLLDANGAARTSLVLPPGLNPALAGATLSHAVIAIEPSTGAVMHISNPVSTLLVP